MVVWLIGILAFAHVFGMMVGGIALLSGDLWSDKTYYQKALMLLGWEYWLAVELIGEK